MRERRAQIHTAHDLPNTRRRHSALDRRTPDAVYFDQANQELVAWNPGKISLKALSKFLGPFLLTNKRPPQSNCLWQGDMILYGRYGYRRIVALLKEAGWLVNDKRVERLRRCEGLNEVSGNS